MVNSLENEKKVRMKQQQILKMAWIYGEEEGYGEAS
jgi:hypothetical protein